MTTLRDALPLRDQRALLTEYLRGIAFPGGSVAGEIIEERLPDGYVRDPIRPALVLWACDAADGDLSDALPVAAAFDLFDRFLVLHAELTDESAAAVARWGLGQSLNAGDAFYALAFHTLASGVANAQRRLEAARLVAQAILEAIDETDETRRRALLTAAALRAGAVVAGASEATARGFAEAGRLLESQPQRAVAALPRPLRRDRVVAFEEVARYVAGRTQE
jgi:hypothetical protein